LMEPIQILLIFMQRMELLLEKTPPEDVRSDVLPMVYRALESGVSQIQELCLSIIPSFAGLLDRQNLKTALLPRIRSLCTTTTLLSVRVNSLICIGKLLEHMDKWQVIDDVLPALPQIPSKEPAVIMAIVGIYKLAFTNSKLGLTKEVMANKVLPFLLPLSIENGLTVAQYNSVTSLIREMMTRVETEHRTKLEQLNSIQEDGKATMMSSTLNNSLPHGQLVPAPTAQEVSSMDNMYSSLGLGGFVNAERKTELATSLISPPASATPSAASPVPLQKSAQNLSLQEKLRLQEKQAQASKQPATQEATKSQPMAKSQSLNMMNPPAKAQPMGQLHPMPMMNHPFLQHQATAFNQSSASMGQSMPVMGQQMGQTLPLSATSTTATSRLSPKPDLSAFDSLLGPAAQNSQKQSMSSLQNLGGNMAQPMTPRNPMMTGLNIQQTTNAARPLSNTDINDLLS